MDQQRQLRKLEVMLFSTSSKGLCERESVGHLHTLVELYRLAALLYLNRAALKYSGHELKHRRLVEEALLLLGDLQVHQASWPLFIIACEAKTDAQRKEVLRLFPETAPRLYVKSSIDGLRHMVQTCWNQDDLHADRGLDYTTKLSAVISSSKFLPPFC